MKAVFFGTPDFAVPSLSRLLAAGVEVPLVVTQPDRPAGRHATPLPSPVARLAAEKGIPVEKPQRLRSNTELLERLRAVAPDVGVVVAYGRLLPAEMLEPPRLSFVNVHASLLPRHRGASPVQAAILAGEKETGVVTMRVSEELDAGPLYLERRAAIGEREDAASLSRRLASEGAELLVETLRGLEAGTLQARPQEGEPSYCRPIRREDGEVNWTLPARLIERKLRAYTPWPGLYTFLAGERIKILAADWRPEAGSGEPGEFRMENGELVVSAGGGSSLLARHLQREGKNAVSGGEFARGVRTPGRFGR
jgi:methionyl-tRNA formyltransferase